MWKPHIFLVSLALIFTAPVITSPKFAFAQTPSDPTAPQSGIVWQVHFFAPGGANGVLDLSLDNGAGKQWHIQLKPWEKNSQITWNGYPALPIDLLGNIATFRCNVIYWPLKELNGAALRADFTQLN